MFRLIPLMLFATIATAAPVPPEDDAARMRRIYGTTVDTAGDSTFELRGTNLRIAIPARPRWAINYFQLGNSSRAERAIKGDFTAVVRVEFPILPRSEIKNVEPAACAGLVASTEDGEHVRVAREVRFYDGKWIESFHAWHTRPLESNGHGVMGGPKGEPVTALVRLSRKGQQVMTAYSRDGKDWSEIGEWTIWGDTVKIGVVAENGNNTPFTATFDQYTLMQPKK